MFSCFRVFRVFVLVEVDGDVSVLRLHFRADRELLPSHGDGGLLLLPMVYQRHLLLHQGKITQWYP